MNKVLLEHSMFPSFNVLFLAAFLLKWQKWLPETKTTDLQSLEYLLSDLLQKRLPTPVLS